MGRPRKPLSQLSPAYRKRLLNPNNTGASLSQKAGKPKKLELLLSTKKKLQAHPRSYPMITRALQTRDQKLLRALERDMIKGEKRIGKASTKALEKNRELIKAEWANYKRNAPRLKQSDKRYYIAGYRSDYFSAEGENEVRPVYAVKDMKNHNIVGKPYRRIGDARNLCNRLNAESKGT